ncbi:MAG: hypothetical protein J6K61_06310 [Clostridia bacterium]|nr:hypothetical protein [Clostridia bacterium]
MKKTRFSLKQTTKNNQGLLRRKDIKRTLIFALPLFAFALCGLYAVVQSGLAALVSFIPPLKNEEIASFATSAISFGFSLLFLSPFWEGIVSFCQTAVLTDEADFSSLFAFFVNKRLFRFAIRRGFGRVFRLALFSGFSVFVAYLGIWASSVSSAPRGALILSLSAAFLLFLLFFFLHLGKDYFLWNHLLSKERKETAGEISPALCKYSALCRASANQMRSHYGKVLGLTLRFMPLFILSLVFLGIPLIFVLPRFMLLRASLASCILKE